MKSSRPERGPAALAVRAFGCLVAALAVSSMAQAQADRDLPGSIEEVRQLLADFARQAEPLRMEANRAIEAAGIEVRRNVAYAEAEGWDPQRTQLDLYSSPEPSPSEGRPIVLYVHGGNWVGGSKEQALFKPLAFVPAGYVMASANYRFRPEVSLVDLVGDVADAAAWLVENAESFGGDPHRLFLIGHSAGAHLVSVLASEPTLLTQAGVPTGAVRGVVSLDTAVYNLPKLVSSGAGPVQSLAFAGDEGAFEDASPWHLVRYARPQPALLLFYSDGRPDANTQTLPFAARVRESGNDVAVLEAKGRNHVELDRELGREGDWATEQTLAFLDEHDDGLYELEAVETTSLPRPLQYSILRPSGTVGEPLPILYFLHGGGGSRDFLGTYRDFFEAAWRDGSLPPALVATVSTSPQSYYLDFEDGSQKWTTLLAEELPRILAERHGGDASRVAIMGYSMGGVGALRVAFRHPESFVAAAGLAAGLEPALEFDELPPWYELWKRARVGAKFGTPLDVDHWEANNPASIAANDPDRLRDSGLQILVECGAEDEFRNAVGSEFLHRVLEEHGIPHEYRLTLGEGHVPVAPHRLREALAFVGRALEGESDLEGAARSGFREQTGQLLRAIGGGDAEPEGDEDQR